jgi:hypothetical protein
MNAEHGCAQGRPAGAAQGHCPSSWPLRLHCSAPRRSVGSPEPSQEPMQQQARQEVRAEEGQCCWRSGASEAQRAFAAAHARSGQSVRGRTRAQQPAALLSAVERAVDFCRDWADLRAELALDLEQRLAVRVREEVDREAQVAVAPRAPHAVQVRLGVLGKVKVDDHVDGLDVDAPREEVT